jgi:hypothetical protein
MRFLEISWDFGILGFSKIFGFFQRFFWIFDELYEDFQSNLPLVNTKMMPMCGGIFTHFSIRPNQEQLRKMQLWPSGRDRTCGPAIPVECSNRIHCGSLGKQTCREDFW